MECHLFYATGIVTFIGKCGKPVAHFESGVMLSPNEIPPLCIDTRTIRNAASGLSWVGIFSGLV